MGDDLDEFLAHLDELSTDSLNIDHKLIKEREKNQKMMNILMTQQNLNKDLLGMLKQEQIRNSELQGKFEHTTLELNAIERQYHELKRMHDNNTLLYKQELTELIEHQKLERDNYVELAKDYFELLSETTLFNNYEIKRSQNKILSKTEKFLYDRDKTWKKPKLIKSRRRIDDETSSITSLTSSRSGKRGNTKTTEIEVKRRKTDIWDLKSISQVSSPATNNKSTATVHLTTTRGTSTVNVVSKSFGVQFPELTMDNIFEDTLFDLPDELAPIPDFEEVIADQHKEMKTAQTMTELYNVNREIDFLCNSPMRVKAERGLSEQQLRIVKVSLQGPRGEIIVSKFSQNITRQDLSTLDGLNWLNDEIINFYMELIKLRSEEVDHLPKVHVMNTFFLGKLMQMGHSGVRRWTRKTDIFSYDIIPVPVHVGGVHWCMSIIHLREKSIKYYDSMGHPNVAVLNALNMYLQEESLDKRKIPFDTSDWTIECVSDCPQQRNGSDCGVFSCMFAEFICRGSKISFDQQHMPYFRQKMVFEIANGRLILGY